MRMESCGKVPQLPDKPTTYKVVYAYNFYTKDILFAVNSSNEHEIKFVLKMQFLKTYFLGIINLKGKQKSIHMEKNL